MYKFALHRLRHVPLRQRLAVVFGLGVVVAALNAWSLRGAIGRITDEVNRMETIADAARLHQQVDMMHDAERADVLAALLASETLELEDDAAARTSIAEHVATARGHLDELATLPLDRDLRVTLTPALTNVAAFGDSARQLVLRASSDPAGVRADLPAFYEEFSRVEVEMDAATHALFEVSLDEARERNQRVALERFLEDGRLPLENNAAERLARLLAVGRKNWLHCASDKGAQRLAVLYTVLTTARHHEADLAAGLAFVLDALARRSYTAEEAIELLPDRWPKARLPATRS